MKLTILKFDGLDDWYFIERAEHDGRRWDEPTKWGTRLMKSSRLSDADVEGTAADMRGIASAIEARRDDLAKQIRAMLGA